MGTAPDLPTPTSVRRFGIFEPRQNMVPLVAAEQIAIVADRGTSDSGSGIEVPPAAQAFEYLQGPLITPRRCNQAPSATRKEWKNS